MTVSYIVEHKRFTPKDPRLGRHVEHDSRSKARGFVHKEAKPATLKTTWWPMQAPGLNQGQTSACTGNSDGQLLNTDYWTPTREKVLGKGVYVDETYARDTLYHTATVLDGYPGTYPPDDTGSSGLAVAKADMQLGFASKYLHALSIRGMISGLQKSPCIVGTNWTQGMFTTDKNYYVKPTGNVSGGHEYLCFACDLEKEELWFRQSWGKDWGTEVPNVCPDQAFRITIPNFTKLLAAQGDATFPVPVTA